MYVTNGLLRRFRHKAFSTGWTDPRFYIQKFLIGSGCFGDLCISCSIGPHGYPLELTSSPFFYVLVFWLFDFLALLGRTVGPAVR